MRSELMSEMNRSRMTSIDQVDDILNVPFNDEF